MIPDSEDDWPGIASSIAASIDESKVAAEASMTDSPSGQLRPERRVLGVVVHGDRVEVLALGEPHHGS